MVLFLGLITWLLFCLVSLLATGPLGKKPTGPLQKTPTGPLKHPTGPLPPPTSTSGSNPPPPTSTTTTTGTGTQPPPVQGGHVPMALLPGQVNTSGGVSNLLFGTNIANYKLSQFDSTAQAQLKQTGITLLRIGALDVSGNTLSDAQLMGFVSGCKAVGAELLMILPHGNAAYSQHVVALYGSNCNLYEFSNEPDLNGISVSTYSQLWNALIPTCRKINPKAAFIGPVLGVVANFQSYIVPFLQATHAAGNLPDAVSFHDYPCTGHPTQAVCSTKTGNIGNDANRLKALIKATVGIDIPIAITEWNVDASANLISYAKDPTFVTPWAIAALEGMAAAGVAMATQFETNGSACCGWLGAAPLATEIAKYKAGGSPPSGVTGAGSTSLGSTISNIGTTIATTVTSIFGGRGFVPVPGTKITLAPTADVTQLLIALDEFMLLQNPFVENMAAIPEDTLNLGVTSFTFTDPFSWIEQFGTNLFYDMASVGLRSLFLIIGTIVMIKVIGEFIDYQALAQGATQGALTVAKFAALA